MNRNFLTKFIKITSSLLFICILTVVLIDPFFQYHKPFFGLKAVLTDKEYQCVGSLKHFDYDSIIAGSSVCENYNNRWFDEGFECTSIKAIRSYGATADLCFLLDIAFQHQDLHYVFYNLDPSALCADPYTTYQQTGCPMYLYDDNYLNDISYVLNKDVLFEKIPYMFAQSFIGNYDEGESYNWAKYKNFNSDMALGLYIRKKNIEAMKPFNEYEDLLQANLNLLISEITAHPDTEFYIFMPPYSMLWWDDVYRCGNTDAYLHNMQSAMEALTAYDNVRFFFFSNDEEIITNLENYMDNLHFSPEINAYICDALISGSHEITSQNIETEISKTKALSDKILTELIVPYEDRILVDIYD